MFDHVTLRTVRPDASERFYDDGAEAARDRADVQRRGPRRVGRLLDRAGRRPGAAHPRPAHRVRRAEARARGRVLAGGHGGGLPRRRRARAAARVPGGLLRLVPARPGRQQRRGRPPRGDARAAGTSTTCGSASPTSTLHGASTRRSRRTAASALGPDTRERAQFAGRERLVLRPGGRSRHGEPAPRVRRRRRRRRSRPSTAPRPAPATATTARRASARSTTRATTARSCSTPTATTSRSSTTTAERPDRPPGSAGRSNGGWVGWRGGRRGGQRRNAGRLIGRLRR